MITFERRFAAVYLCKSRDVYGNRDPHMILSLSQPEIQVGGVLRLWWKALDPAETDHWRLGNIYMAATGSATLRLNNKIMLESMTYLVDSDVVIVRHEKPNDDIQIKLIPESQFHRAYGLIKRRNSGNFGTVWEAEHRASSKAFAVKKIVLPQDQHQSRADALLRLSTEREIDIMSQIRHTNIIPLEEIFVESETEGRTTYIVMKLAHSSIAQWLIENGPFSPYLTRKLAHQIGSGLAYLHSIDVTHRDVKPANVLIVSFNPLQIALTDFGLSKKTDGTFLASYCGTPAYMGPEVTALRDIYFNKVDAFAFGWMVPALLLGEQVVTNREIRGLPDTQSMVNAIVNEIPLVKRGRVAINVFKNFLSQLIEPNPDLRMSVTDAMEHAYFAGLKFTLPPVQPRSASLLRTQPVSDRPPLIVHATPKDDTTARDGQPANGRWNVISEVDTAKQAIQHAEGRMRSALPTSSETCAEDQSATPTAGNDDDPLPPPPKKDACDSDPAFAAAAINLNIDVQAAVFPADSALYDHVPKQGSPLRFGFTASEVGTTASEGASPTSTVIEDELSAESVDDDDGSPLPHPPGTSRGLRPGQTPLEAMSECANMRVKPTRSYEWFWYCAICTLLLVLSHMLAGSNLLTIFSGSNQAQPPFILKILSDYPVF